LTSRGELMIYEMIASFATKEVNPRGIKITKSSEEIIKLQWRREMRRLYQRIFREVFKTNVYSTFFEHKKVKLSEIMGSDGD
jgi:hypothetical protein